MEWFQLSKTREIVERRRPSEFMQYLTFDGETNLFYLEDHSVGFAFEVAPLLGAGDDTENVIRGLYESLPPGSVVTINVYANPNVEYWMSAIKALREQAQVTEGDELAGKDVLQEVIRQRMRYYQRGTRESLVDGADLRVRDISFFVSVKCKVPHQKEVDAFMDEMVLKRRNCGRILETAGLYPMEMDAEVLLVLLGRIWNFAVEHPGGPEHKYFGYQDGDLIKDQIVRSDVPVEIYEDHLRIGDGYVKSLSVRQYPEKWQMGRNGDFLGSLYYGNRSLPFPFLITHVVIMVDQEEYNSRFQKKYGAVNYQAFGPMARVCPRLGAKKRNYDVVAEGLEGGDSLVRTFLNYQVFGGTLSEAEENAAKMESYFRTLGFVLNPDKFINFPLLVNCLPLNYDLTADEDLYRAKTVLATGAASLSPLVGDWKGSTHPVITYVSRRGQLMGFDLFDSSGGYSGYVAAQTGSGKSFLINDMITSYLSIGARLWVVDVGRSYKKLCEILGGEFIVFSLESTLCLNPFTFVEDLADEMDELKEVLACMASPNQTIDDLQKAFLEEAIKTVFNDYGKETTISRVATVLREHGDTRANDLGTMLFPYTSEGAYGRFFEGENNVRFKSRFVVIELEELKSKRQLQTSVLLQCIMRIQKAMYFGRKDERKFVIIDEAWDLLAQPTTAKFIEHGYRRFRKYGGGALVVTQGVNDLYNSNTGRAIVENSAFGFLLKQKGEALNYLKREGRLNISECDFGVLQSLQTVRGQYSEIYFHTPFGRGVGRLVVDRWNQLVYTTDPSECALIDDLIRQEGLTVKEAIDWVIATERARGKEDK